MQKNMNRQRRLHTLQYQVADFITAMLSWACFFVYRKQLEAPQPDWSVISTDTNFWYGVLVIPTGWLLFYSIFDQYRDIYRQSLLFCTVQADEADKLIAQPFLPATDFFVEFHGFLVAANDERIVGDQAFLQALAGAGQNVHAHRGRQQEVQQE